LEQEFTAKMMMTKMPLTLKTQIDVMMKKGQGV